MRFRTEHMIRLMVLVAMLIAGSAQAAQNAPLSSQRACKLLLERMGVHDGVPSAKLKKTWRCDITEDSDNEHTDWWVIGLRSFRKCAGWWECSNLRGWFAVNRNTGEIREWDVGEDAVGGPIGSP